MMMTRTLALSGLLAVATASGFGQASVAPVKTAGSVDVVPAHDSLLPDAFGGFKKVADAPAVTEPGVSLVNARKEALQESSPKRSEVESYAGSGRTLRVEAVEFGDYSGAYSAFTMLRKPGVADGKDLGRNVSVADGAVMFVSGATLVVAFPAGAADLKALQPLAASIPQVHGSQAQPPLLPGYLPAKGLVPGSVRYALGPASYAAQGGVLPATSIGWDKSAEAVTAKYSDKHGEETLTLLLYPTPQITRAHLKSVQGLLPEAKSRSENELVMLATGKWAPDVAAKWLEGIHMKQSAAVDTVTMADPGNPNDVPHTATLLHGIALLAAFLCGACVLLGLFFGGGRALVRVLRGKDAAMDVEFLSLHLANQNAKAEFTGQSKG